MTIRVLGFVLFALMCSSSALATLPPMSQAELEERSDLIVEATVRQIEKVGQGREDHCYGWQDYRATLAVNKTEKGDATLTTIHVRYADIVNNDKGCVGGSTAYSLTLGAQYHLYLKRDTDGDYIFINWAGVKQIVEKGSAPAAPATSAAAPPEHPKTPPPVASSDVAPVPAAPAKNGGCACNLGPSGPRPSIMAVFLLLVALMRRRASTPAMR
jgi:hypothetical protein